MLVKIAAWHLCLRKLDLYSDPVDELGGGEAELFEVARGHRFAARVVPQYDAWKGLNVEPDLEPEVPVQVHFGKDNA